MKLIIQIPCFNEANTLAMTLKELPRAVPGFDIVEWLVIDDGSRDATADVAKENGADHVVRHVSNQGLARAFMTGLDAALKLGADVIVNTDGDNQYCAHDIPLLTQPILDGSSELVIGARPIDNIDHFSPLKKCLQKIGSRVVRTFSKTDVPDTTSGFRAMSRSAAQRLIVFSDYTYTLETIIQAGLNNMAITSVPVRVNEQLRASRLIRSIPSYISHSMMTIIRIFIIYRPLFFFGTVGLALFIAGSLIGIRFLWYYIEGSGTGHVQSLILAAVLLMMGFQTVLVAIDADLMAANRRLLQDIRLKHSMCGQDQLHNPNERGDG